MVGFVNVGPNRSGKLADLLGSALGQGLGSFSNSYFANKALEGVINDKELSNAEPHEKLGRLQSALAPFGELGQNMFNQRLKVEEARLANEKLKREKEDQKLKTTKELLTNQAVNKLLKGEELTDQEENLIPANVRLHLDKKTQSSKPIDPEQLQLIKKVRNSPGFNQLDELGQYQAFTDAGVSKENAEAESKLRGQQLTRQEQGVDRSFKQHDDFISNVTNTYKTFETDTKPKLLQMQSIPAKDLVSPTAATFLDAVGIPLGALENPSSELFKKLSLDLLKGLPETYGNRILKVEVDNFLKTIPDLVNSADGRRMIASNILKLGEMKEVYYNEMRRQQKEAIDNNKPLSRDFEQRVFDQVKPQIDRINNEFVKLSEITSLPEDHVPFFAPDGSVKFIPKKDMKWAEENGGRRIW